MWLKTIWLIGTAFLFMYYRPVYKLISEANIINAGTPASELMEQNLDKRDDPLFNEKIYASGVKGL